MVESVSEETTVFVHYKWRERHPPGTVAGRAHCLGLLLDTAMFPSRQVSPHCDWAKQRLPC